jgi:ATP-dependent DNA ligase
VIVVDHTGKVSFNGLQHSRPNGHIQFYAFDVLIHRGRNVLRLPIEERRLLLTEALRKVEYPVIQSTPFDVKPAELIRAAKELEFEGVIAKRKGSLYEPRRRTGAWVKYKLNRSQEFVIRGYTAGNPFDAPIVGCYDDCRQDAFHLPRLLFAEIGSSLILKVGYPPGVKTGARGIDPRPPAQDGTTMLPKTNFRKHKLA